MKKMKFITNLIAILFMFNACGSSSSSSTPTNNSEKISINKLCTSVDDIDSYIRLQKGDIIKKDLLNSKIQIYHDDQNNKRVCLKSGKAHIERIKK